MRFGVLAATLVAMVSTATAAESIADLSAKATAGDYLAQRNLAYTYATGSAGQKKDPASACSWYLLVMRSDSPKLNVGDVGNVVTYCDKLDSDQRLAAERRANGLYRLIYQKP